MEHPEKSDRPIFLKLRIENLILSKVSFKSLSLIDTTPINLYLLFIFLPILHIYANNHSIKKKNLRKYLIRIFVLG